jgi:hypothetical protein
MEILLALAAAVSYGASGLAGLVEAAQLPMIGRKSGHLCPEPHTHHSRSIGERRRCASRARASAAEAP